MNSASRRHFLKLDDISPDEFRRLLSRASELKKLQHAGTPHTTLSGKTMAMVFEKSSTRTRVSFETGMAQLGGHALFLSPRDTQLGRGEPVEDTARVLSSMVDIIMMRTFEHEKLQRFAEYSSVPVINGLTDLCHPCQLLADMQTYFENCGDIRGKRVAYIGDGNNMCHSYMGAASSLDFELVVAAPQGYQPDTDLLAHCHQHTRMTHDPAEACRNADLIVTDVWTSMGQEDENAQRRIDFQDYQVNAEMMALANDDAVFMHCLPAHREEEVTDEVLEGPQSLVWQEAENRLHAQKALMEFLLLPG